MLLDIFHFYHMITECQCLFSNVICFLFYLYNLCIYLYNKKIIHVQNDTKNNIYLWFHCSSRGSYHFVSKLLYIYCWVEEHVIYLVVVTLWGWCLVVNEVSWWMSQVTMSFVLVFKLNSKWNTLLFEFLQVLFWLPFLKPIKRIWCEEHEGFALIRRVRGDNLFLFIFFVNCICLCVQKLEACAVNYFNKLCKLNLCSYFNN